MTCCATSFRGNADHGWFTTTFSYGVLADEDKNKLSDDISCGFLEGSRL